MPRLTNATKNAKPTVIATTPKRAATVGTTRAARADLMGVKLRQQKNRPIPFDVTRQNAIIKIKSPRTGETATLKVVTQPTTAKFFPDKGEFIRVAYLFRGDDPNNVTHWRGFALVDEFGVNVFGTCKGGDEPSMYEKLAGMLEQPTFFRDKGCEYTIHLLDS